MRWCTCQAGKVKSATECCLHCCWLPGVETAPVSCGRVRRSFNICFTFGENWFWLSLVSGVRTEECRTHATWHTLGQREKCKAVDKCKYGVCTMYYVLCTVYVLCVLWHWCIMWSRWHHPEWSKSRDSVTLSHNNWGLGEGHVHVEPVQDEILGSTFSFQPSYKHMSLHVKLWALYWKW